MEKYFENLKTEKTPVIFVLSGAGLSAESGIATFRDKNGLWIKNNARELATVEALAKNPDKVFEFYNKRFETVCRCQPNSAHYALAKFARETVGFCEFVHVTQNVDWLNELAGTPQVYHLHGSLNQARCNACGAVFPRPSSFRKDNVCPSCGAKAYSVRPDVVLFGERPYFMDWIPNYLKRTDVFIAVGTSGEVYPAASFSRLCKNAIKININPAEAGHIENSSYFHFHISKKSTEALPALLEALTLTIKESASCGEEKSCAS